MNLTTITDLNIPELKLYQLFRDKSFSEDGSFIADSPKVVNLLLESDIEIKSILASYEYYEEYKELIESRNIPHLYVADKTLMGEIVGHKIHHNCMMHAIRPKEYGIEELGDQIIMLDEISSTQNIGAIARSAAALGIDSYLLPRRGPHPYSRRALRVSMGYVSKLKNSLYDDIFETISALKKAGYTIYGAEISDDSIELSQIKIDKKWVLLMGHEGNGLSKEILEVCDYAVEIEMIAGVKSFNVGIAASILMYQFRQSSGEND